MVYLKASLKSRCRGVRPGAVLFLFAAAVCVSWNSAVAALGGPCFDGCGGNTGTDSDRDGLSDCVEECLGTNAALVDSDDDGLPDVFEVDHDLDPLDAADAALDTDEDLLINLDEFLAGSNPRDPASPRELLFVDPAGTDEAGRGTRSLPLRTIAFALSLAGAGDPGHTGIVLLPGTYREDPVLLPGVALRGATGICDDVTADTCATIQGSVTGAANATLENLTLTSFDPTATLLSLDNVAMQVRGVAFIGSGERLAVGVQCFGEAPRNAVFFDCFFASLDIGIEIMDTIPQLLFSDLENCASAQIHVHATALPNATPPGLGDATRSDLGWNRFLGDADETVLINDRYETVKIERNEWDMEQPAMIRGRIIGPADFEPFLPVGEALLAAAIFLTVLDGGTQDPITAATVSVSPSGISELTENTDGLYAFPVLPEGNYDIEVSAPGYQSVSLDVDLLRGDTKSMVVPLDKESGGGDTRNCHRPSERRWPSPGDTLVGLLLLAACTYTRNQRAL